MTSKRADRTAVPRQIFAALAGLLIAVSLATFTGGTAARADDTDGVSGAPSQEQGVDGRSRFSYQVKPGQELKDFYIVRNTGTTEQTMRVFATDAYNTADGSFGLLNTAAKPKDAGSWVSFTSGVRELSIPLAPGASQIVPFTLTVPADAAPGDHPAGIVISSSSVQGTILVDRRVATRLYVRVAGALQPSLTVGNIVANYKDQINPLGGIATVSFTVRNNGNVALGATVISGISTYFTIGASKVTRQTVAEILPGATRKVTVRVADVAALGYLNASVHLLPTVDPEALNPGVLRDVERNLAFFAMPWWILVALLVLIAGWGFSLLRRRNDTVRAARWMAYTEAEAVRKAEHNTPELVNQ